MIKYDKDSWPQFTLGPKRLRRCWPGWIYWTHWAEVCYDPGHRVLGHIGWVVFWFDWFNGTHLTLALGPHTGTWGKSSLRGGNK